ncbi:ricin-type beta-trefoil lectin domain protein [Streptomyces sp. NPDC048527]|uniref:ricin-type beta-trefoil lectin domain protein n=1 Tax=Streptomyces sp. NPDC048527 TaxID=3365568 RepID=UPI00371F26C0
MTATRTPSADAATPGRRRAGIRLALLAAPTGVALAAAVLASAPAQAADTGGNDSPITGFGGQCLDVQGAGTQDFTPVQMYTCNGTEAQKWTLNKDSSTLHALGKCLDVQYGGTANGTPVELHDCNGTGAQVWINENNHTFYNPQSNRCLDDTDWSTAPGTQSQIWDCTGNCSQEWSAPWRWDESSYPQHPARVRQS